MSETYVEITRAPPRGMITLRADLEDAKVKTAVKKAMGKAMGLGVPVARTIAASGDHALAWMAPDELLILCPHDAAPGLAARMQKALAGVHHLVAEVSDARALFRLRGDLWREVLAKLTPADLSPGVFGVGEMRRTRLAQVAAAFWVNAPDEVEIICFSSVADYMETLLRTSALGGSEIGLL